MNDFGWLDELPDYGAAPAAESVVAPAAPAAEPLPIPEVPVKSAAVRSAELDAFVLAGRYDTPEIRETLARNKELEGLAARRRKLDGLNSRAVAGQTVLRYAFPELKGEPGAYFTKQGKELPDCQTRTDAFAAVYDDYLAGVEAEYKKLLERRAAWQAHKVEVSQAVVDVVAGRTAPAALHERLTPEQMEVYQKEFDADATEKAGVAMGLLREAFAGDAETGLKNMVNQGLANRVTAVLSDLNEEGELVLNEKAVGMFQGALTALMQEAKGKSGEEYKFLHNLLVGLGNPVRRRSKDIQGVLGLMVQADTAAALAMAGRKVESQEVQEQMQEGIEELRGRWRNDEVYARLRGMLDAAQSEGNATAETADFLAKSVNVLGSVVGQTAPFFVPGVGAGIAFLQAFDEKRNAAYFKGLKPGTAEWSAFIDAATSVAVEKIAFGSVSRVSGTVKLLEKVPGYGPVRNALLGSFYWRAVAEVGAGVLEESAVEPSAEALLQWMIRGGASVWGDVGGRYDWAKYAEELKGMFQPEQLAATVIFGAGLTGMQSPLIKDAAKGYSRHVEYLMGQGIGREEARNISAMEDAEERVKAAAAAKAEAWKDPEVAKANQRAAAVAFAEIAEARAVVESRAYAELRQELRLPEVEKVSDKEGRYLITTYNRVDGTELYRGEVGEEQLLAMLNHYIKQEDDLRVRRAQSAMGANAMLRAVEATGEVVVEDMGAAKNPESGERVISELGAMGEAEFRYAAELALDEFEARKAAGMSEGEALATPFEALSRYMPLGSWLKLEAAFKQRLATAGETSGEEGADATRLLNTVPAAGTTKADSLFLAATGQVGAREVLEDTLEHKQKKVTGNDPAKLQAWHRLLKDAQKEVRRLGFNLSFYQGEDGMDAAALQEKVTEGMSKLASAHVLANADALPLPAWVKELLRWHMAALEDAAGIVVLAEAYRQGRERGNIGQEIEEVLADLGKKVASMYAQAELTEADVQAYRDARARYKELTGDVTPSAEEVRAEQDAADARERERVTSAVDTKSVIPPSDDERTDVETFSPAGDLPEEVRAAFPKGACYNIGARAWLGMVPVARLHLSPDAPQVKVGSNKKGVVNPLVGDYRADAPPVYVWQRKNGTLEVISGRHRLDLAKRTNTEMIAAYVYPEDAAHDAKWARLLDYEQNMQDDQADELTAAIYVRETQLSDEELTRRGLTRGGTKSARGILIGREAREDLWSRFQSRAVDPRMAEAICRLTMHMPDASRIDAMQAMAAADLAKGKSLEHVAAKLQLMAHADADGEATQGLLSFGESFDEALERSAEFIAKSIEVINKHIAAVTKARSLGKGGVSEQEGISVGLDMDPKQRLAELNELKAAYEKCGFHEKIRFRALTWDGKSDVDPIGDYARDKAAAAELAGPTAEELEQQARDAAAEATGTFGFATYTTRQLSRAYATDAAGNKLDADTFITTPNGNLDWYIFPQDDKTQKLLASRRIKNLPIRLTVGKQTNQTHRGFGLIHMLNHFDDYVKVGETPLLHLYNTLSNLVKIRGGALGRYNFKGEYEGEDSKLIAQLLEEDGYYSIITSYPEQMDRRPQAGELVIGRVLFQFPSNSGKNQIHVSKSQSNAVTASVSTNGQASAGNVAQSPAQVNIYDVRIKDSSGNLIFQQPVEAKANFSVARNLAVVSAEMDARYMDAVKRGDMDAAQRMVNDVARMRGYMADSDYQGSECFNGTAPSANAYFDTDEERYEAWENGEFEGTVSLADFVRRGMEPGNLEWLITSPGAYQRADEYQRESIEAIRKAKSSKRGKVTIYRAVPADIKEDSVRNGDWVTFSKKYAEYHISLQDWEKGRIIKQVVPIDDVWWDGNDVNEWGYDDGKEYAYRNTANNRKLLDAVTYDKNGDIVPLSKRFDYSSPDVSFSVVGEKAANWDKIKHRAFKGRDDGKLRVELDASGSKVKDFPNAYPVQEVMRKLVHDGLYDSEDYMVYSSLAFAEDMTREERGERKLSETELKEDCDKYPDLAEEVELGLKAAGLTWESDVQEARGACFTALGKWKKTLEAELKQRNIEKPTGEAWHALVEQKPGLGSANVGKRVVSAWSGKWLDDVLDFPELYKAYPQLRSIQLAEDTGMELADASYADFARRHGAKEGKEDGQYPFGFINMNPKSSAWSNEQEAKGLLLHEVQHAIQGIEGFAKGGNPKTVRETVEKLLENDGFRIEWLERDLRWFAAINIARDYLNEAKRLRKYPNAWKYSGQRFRWSRISSSAEEIREAILRDIAERYEAFRRDDTAETLLLDMNDSLLPVVRFSSLESIEAGLEKLKMLKSRKQAFRGTSAKKGRKLADLQKRYDRMKRVLDKFKYEPFELYRRMAGEIESRNVELRRDWTAEQRAARPFNETLEYPGEALVAFSVTSMSEAAQGLLEGNVKVSRVEELVKDFNAQIANWNRVAAGKMGRADARTGAEMFGAVQALLSSARRVLPEGYRANVYTLMQWASVYAGMAETGQLPAAGALKGKPEILEAFKRKMLNETSMAANQFEAEAMLASIGEQKLNEVMVKVLQQVRGQLVRYAKDELWSKVLKVVDRAYAKDEAGKKPRRGKMAAVDYERLEQVLKLLRMDPEEVREEMNGLQGKISEATAERAAELEAELQDLSVFGGWSGMSLQQAMAAHEALVLLVSTGRTSWQKQLDRRKAEIEWLAREMSRALPTDKTVSGTRNAERTRLWRAMKRLPYGFMSYSQLMLALSNRLGEQFCFDRIQEMTDANAALLNAEKDRMYWMLKLVQKVSGKQGEVACEKWLADFDTPEDTKIVLSPMSWCEVTMTVEAAEAWLAAGKEERTRQWEERRKDEDRLKRSLREERPMVPEELIPELRKAVKEYKGNKRKKSGKVTVRGEYEEKGRAKTLTCSRDAALYAILLHEQDDYSTVFVPGRPDEVKHGLLYREGLNTPAKIQQLYDFVGPAGLAYGYALRKRLQEQGLTVGQVWEAREGVPFKFRDNYFRASFDRLAIQDKNPLTDGRVNGMGGGKYGMLVNRVPAHQEPAKWDMGASMVFLAASLEQDNYIFTSHITDLWSKLLMQREFARRLQAYVGDDVMRKLVLWMDAIDGAPLDNMSAFMNLSHWQGFFTGAWAASVLNGNGYVLMKQSSALLHGYLAGYVPESIKEQEDGVREVAHRHIGFWEFLGHAVSGGPITMKEIEETEYVRARRTAQGRGVATQGMQDAGRKRSALAVPSEKLGELIEKVDVWINKRSVRAFANAFYTASKKLNEENGNLLTEDQLRQGALQAVGRVLELGAQPLTRMQKGIFQNGSGMLGKMTFAMKSESINKLGLMSAQAVRGERVSPLVGWISLGVFNAAVTYLIAMLQGDEDDEKNTWVSHATSVGISTATGPLSAVPILSESLAELASWITGERVYSADYARQIVDAGGLVRGVRKIYRHHAGVREMGWEDYFKTLTALVRASGAGFGAFSRSGSEAVSSFGSLMLSAAAGANVSRLGKDVLTRAGLFEPQKKSAKKSQRRRRTRRKRR